MFILIYIVFKRWITLGARARARAKVPLDRSICFTVKIKLHNSRFMREHCIILSLAGPSSAILLFKIQDLPRLCRSSKFKTYHFVQSEFIDVTNFFGLLQLLTGTLSGNDVDELPTTDYLISIRNNPPIARKFSSKGRITFRY